MKPDTEPMTQKRVFEVRDLLLENMQTWIIGQKNIQTRLVNAQFMRVAFSDKITGKKLLAPGHFLLIGGTGKGKTDNVVSLSLSVRGMSNRVQGSPDLKVIDILGDNDIFEDANGKREIMFTPGPIFCNFLLIDEDNRLAPKTISAVLEGMEERSVTPSRRKINLGFGIEYRKYLPLFPISGDLNDIFGPRWFSTFLTQNPFGEEEGTYPTPQALWDRISMHFELPRPSFEDEMKIRPENVVGKEIKPVTNLNEMHMCAEYIYQTMRISKAADIYQTRLVRNTDPDPNVEKEPKKLTNFVKSHIQKEKCANPRVHFHLRAAAVEEAFFSGSMVVRPEHVRAVAFPVITHRVKLIPKLRHKMDVRDIFAEILEATPIPRRGQGGM